MIKYQAITWPLLSSLSKGREAHRALGVATAQRNKFGVYCQPHRSTETRDAAEGEGGGISVHLIAGTKSVLLAMNATKDARRELLGFAIGRRTGDGTPITWLDGYDSDGRSGGRGRYPPGWAYAQPQGRATMASPTAALASRQWVGHAIPPSSGA
jgi:hypothetical protein